MKTLMHRDKSQLKEYFTSNLFLVVVVCMLTLCFSAVLLIRNVRQSELHSAKLELTQKQENVDSMMRRCINISSKIASNPLFFINRNLTEYPSTETMSALNQYFDASMLTDLILLFDDTRIPFFYSPVGSMSLNHFDSFFQMENLSLECLNEYIKTLISPVLIPTTYSEARIKVYALLIPMNRFSSGGPALSIFLIPQKKMAQLSASTEGGELILSQLNTVPISFSGSTDGEALQELTNNFDTEFIMYDGRKAYYQASEIVGWSYWMLLPRTTLSDLSIVGLLTIGAITLLVGSFLSYHAAKRTYAPLSGLISTIHPAEACNEFEALRNFIGLMQEKQEHALRHEQFLKRNVYAMLTSGELNGVEQEDLFDMLELPDNARFFQLIKLGGNFDKTQISTIVAKASLNWYQLLDNSSTGTCLIMLASDHAEPFNTQCEALAQLLWERFPLAILCISCIYSDILSTPQILTDLNHMLQYRYIYPHGLLHQTDRERYNSDGSDIHVASIFQNLSQALVQGETDEARKLILLVLDLLSTHYSPGFYIKVVYNLATLFQEIIPIAEMQDDYARMTSPYCMTEAELKEIIERFFAQWQKHQPQRNVLKKSDVLNCIETQCYQEDFSLQKLADTYCVSAPVMSRFIKASLGITFTDYVTQKRIRMAEKLLSNTEMPITQIIEQIGYNNINNFYRRFKLLNGITPSAYRNLHRERN